MHSNNTKYKELRNKYLEPSMEEDFCEVSKASVEIMLDRFCNGNEIGFPFINN
tara:strand:+ start:767 stop:925 length:159 start_codon:yes stop_codon:yes gene_type:complete